MKCIESPHIHIVQNSIQTNDTINWDLIMANRNELNPTIIVEDCRKIDNFIYHADPREEVYACGYDSAGNYHWIGTITGYHIVKM